MKPDEVYPDADPDDEDPAPSRMMNVPGERSGCGVIFVNMFAKGP